ncbi:MAG TPA: hypothetical protein VGC88_04270 [Terriglobales bacterium]
MKSFALRTIYWSLALMLAALLALGATKQTAQAFTGTAAHAAQR